MNKLLYEKLKQLKPELKAQFGIEKFALFGSQARSDYVSNSDIDLLIIKIKKKDAFIRLKAKRFIEKKLKKRVDIGYYETIRPVIKESIKEDLKYV